MEEKRIEKIKTFLRYHEKSGISLKEMQERCKREKRGLCCYRYTPDFNFDLSTPFMQMTAEGGEKGEVIIFQGEVWGLCPEGYTVYPTKIIKRIPVICKRDNKGYKIFKRR